MERISNKNARKYVETRREFKGSNTFGEWINDRIYAVYSYGRHFPIYVCINGQWYGNREKYSHSTSVHQSRLMPYNVDIEYVSCQTLRNAIR